MKWIGAIALINLALVSSCQVTSPQIVESAGLGADVEDVEDVADVAAIALAVDPINTSTARLTHVYDCDFTGNLSMDQQVMDKRFIVQMSRSDKPAFVWLFVDTTTIKLASSSDDHFGAQGFRLALSPTVSLQSATGNWSNCVEDRYASIWEDAKLRGVDFRATGNEPGWVMEMTGSNILLKLDYGERVVEQVVSEPEVFAARRMAVFSGDDLRIEIQEADCQDSMRGDHFSSKVELVITGKQYLGCGRALH